MGSFWRISAKNFHGVRKVDHAKIHQDPWIFTPSGATDHALISTLGHYLLKKHHVSEPTFTTKHRILTAARRTLDTATPHHVTSSITAFSLFPKLTPPQNEPTGKDSVDRRFPQMTTTQQLSWASPASLGEWTL